MIEPSRALPRPRVDDTLRLPVDQYQRYRCVADLVRRKPRVAGPLRVLDVGGATGLLRRFLPAEDVVIVDLRDSEQGEAVRGDGCRLPFLDGSFDVVVAVDTLEHLQSADREAFVIECARVSRGWVCLAGPYRTPEVERAEELLRDFLADKMGVEHRFLEEHRTHGLPVRAEVETRLRALGASVRSFGNAKLERWLPLMCMELYMDDDPILRPLAKRFHEFYNDTFGAEEERERPVYRHVVVGSFDGSLPTDAPVEDRARVIEAGLRATSAFALELLALDRERDVWRPELDRLEGANRGLERDLRGHRVRLAEVEADLAQHRAVQRNTARDLEGHRERLVEVETELSRHREVEAELRAELAAHVDERERLTARLDETEAGAQDLENELADARAGAAKLNDIVRDKDAELTRLRRALRSRAESLIRFFVKRPA